MKDIISGFFQAINLIFHADPTLYQIVARSLSLSGVSLFVSALIGIPMGAWLGFKNFIGRGIVTVFLYTGMGLPPVVVGLFVYLMLSRTGPFGDLHWLFSLKAMIVAQVIISFPLVAGFTMAAVMGLDPRLSRQIRALGATPWQTALTMLREARTGVIVSIVAGFGAIISEVGSVMMVGGNIAGHTRVLTTAIVLETQKGNFDLAMALGIILLGLTFITNSLILWMQEGHFVRK